MGGRHYIGGHGHGKRKWVLLKVSAFWDNRESHDMEVQVESEIATGYVSNEQGRIVFS